MTYHDLSKAQQKYRKEIADKTRRMIISKLTIDAEDETSVMTSYRNYYLQISFSELHPLMVFCLAKTLKSPCSTAQVQLTNELNLKSILGSHAINNIVGCYSYRATHWLDTELEAERFFEILNRCIDEADKAYFKLAG